MRSASCSGAGILIEDQVEAARRGAADRRFAAGRDPQRRMRLSAPAAARPRCPRNARSGRGGRSAGASSNARVITATASSKRASASSGAISKALELAVAVALADAEIETAAGDQIERRRLLGEQHRIVPGQHHHRRAEPQRRGAHGERHQQHQGRRHLVPAGEMMLDQKARLKAERLGLDIEIEIVAKTLAGLRRQIVAVGLRRAEQAEFHGRAHERSCRVQSAHVDIDRTPAQVKRSGCRLQNRPAAISPW